MVAALLLFGAIGAVRAAGPEEAAPDPDPWEAMNRRIFDFNEAVDREFAVPVAVAYQGIVPRLVRHGVTNFFANLADAWTSANLVLQVKPQQALEMGMRTMVNTFFGLGGVLDMATEMGLNRFTIEDAGQTLGYWGVPSGPYLVLPVLGPSSVRDGVGVGLDYQWSTINRVLPEVAPRNAAGLLNLLNTRETLLNASRVLDEIALDKYLLLRDGYLARRRSQLYDGDPPDEAQAPAPYRNLLHGAPPAQ